MPQVSRRRALAILAKSADGRTEAILRARGITQHILAGLIRDGLASASTARVGRWLVDVVRIKITEAGRTALADGTIEPPSIPSVDPTLTKTNSKAEEECVVEDERRNLADECGNTDKRCDLANEILRLSPPQPGCEKRARFVFERSFSLAELQVLVEALRGGFHGVVKPEQTYYTN